MKIRLDRMIFILRNSLSNFPKATMGRMVRKNVAIASTLVTTVILLLIKNRSLTI